MAKLPANHRHDLEEPAENSQLSQPRRSYDLLYSTLTSRHRDLSEPARRLTELLINDPWALAFDSCADLAKKCSSSESSIVRFTQMLGYSGVREFRSHYRVILMDRAKAAKRR